MAWSAALRVGACFLPCLQGEHSLGDSHAGVSSYAALVRCGVCVCVFLVFVLLNEMPGFQTPTWESGTI
jgi:hypothetical protein